MKKITWIIFVTWLVLTYSLSANAMNHEKMKNIAWGTGMMWNMEMMKSCPVYKNMTEEEKTKFDSMTMEEKKAFMHSKMWSWAMMWSGSMMNSNWHKMWNWMKMGNNKSMTKINDTLNKFFEKLDKEEIDNVKKIETLEKVIAKIDTILADTSLVETKKTIYNHIKHLIEQKIQEIEWTDIELDWLLEIN